MTNDQARMTNQTAITNVEKLSRAAGPAVVPWLLASAMAMALAAGCSAPPVELVETHAAPGGKATIRVVAPNEKIARAAADAAWKEMNLCMQLLDPNRKPSEAWLKNDPHARVDPRQMPSDVWRINDTAGKLYSIEVDPVTAACLEICTEAYKATDGSFDPSVGPLADLWREAENRGQPPTEEEIAKARAVVNFKNVEITIAKVAKAPDEMPRVSPNMPAPNMEDFTKISRTVGVHKGMSLDMAGITGGYAALRMASRMKEAGAVAGLVAVGREVATFGDRPVRLIRHIQGKPQENINRKTSDKRWPVGVPDPRFPDDPARTYTTLMLRDEAVATVSPLAGGFTIGGRRYGSVIDPKTGQPAAGPIASVTVVAYDAALAEAYATAIVAMGVEKGMAMAGVEGLDCLILEVGPKDLEAWQSGAALPADAELIAHRSSGLAEMEAKSGADGE